MRRRSWLMPLMATSLAFGAQAQDKRLAIDPSGVARLVADSGGTAQVSIHEATGAARFVRATPGNPLGIRVFGRALSDDAKKNRSVQFLNNYRSLFGINAVETELAAPRMARDRHGATHLSYKQVYRGLPVFGAELKAHFDPSGELTVVNGTFVPAIEVDTTPARTAEQASAAAITAVNAEQVRKVKPLSAKPTLMIYREGLAQGIAGANHLAWQVEVGNQSDVREFVYVDAHSGKIIDRITGTPDAKVRRAFDGAGATQPGPNYPNKPFWVEGQPFPTGTLEADNMIQASSEIYDLFSKAFGRDSFDGKGAVMDSIFNRGDGCPNASWGGQYISFCPGTTTDDITAHEWGHAYTEYTHALIYQYQPGALNEAYSDIWGETVDRINGRQTDTPDNPRTTGACTAFTPNPPTVNITAPASIAGPRSAGGASFGPTTFSISGAIAGVNVGSTSAGCNALPANSLAGKIAFIDRGSCGFSIKAQNAEQAGAIGTIIGNNVAGTAPTLGATAGTVNTTPTLSVSQADGTAIKAALANATVTASLVRGGNGTDNSVRWLIGEDSAAFGGAIRDMYTPTCYGNPGKVSDPQYACASTDNGGVHNNSGVANHGYALLVDGGAYNGQTISGIGLTKAAHIYWRAQSVYQGPASGFPDHADALQQSCTDLVGASLNGLTTGTPSGETITTNDCAQVTKMAQAVELRMPASQCGFQPLLAQSPPAACSAGTSPSNLLADGFDGGKRAGVRWQVSHSGGPGYVPRDWGVVNNLPSGRSGYAIYAVDYTGGTCGGAADQSGVMRLESPEITIPAGVPTRLSFDHWVSTEAGYDGGNVKISVNGGVWQVLKASDFVYNAYNTTLATAAAGNTNPMAGEPAFSGSDGGSVYGSWGRSIVNLVPYAVAGDKIKLRFEMGNDGCGGTFGWYLDDIAVYSCRP